MTKEILSLEDKFVKPLRKPHSKKPKENKMESLNLFWAAPEEARFSDKIISIVLDCERKTLQQHRWYGKGISFSKISGKILYKKADVVAYLEKYKSISSTSEFAEVSHEE